MTAHGDVSPHIPLVPFLMSFCQKERQHLLEGMCCPDSRCSPMSWATQCLGCCSWSGWAALADTNSLAWICQKVWVVRLAICSLHRVGVWAEWLGLSIGQEMCCPLFWLVMKRFTCKWSHRWVLTASLLGLFPVHYPYHHKLHELFFTGASLSVQEDLHPGIIGIFFIFQWLSRSSGY